MRRNVILLGLLVFGVGTLRARGGDDVPDLRGEWTLASMTIGRTTVPKPFDYLLVIRQEGASLTLETVKGQPTIKSTRSIPCSRRGPGTAT